MYDIHAHVNPSPINPSSVLQLHVNDPLVLSQNAYWSHMSGLEHSSMSKQQSDFI